MRNLGIKPPEYIEDALDDADDRLCTHCRTRKPLAEFTKWHRGRGGLAPHCKACKKRKRLEYCERNRERLAKKQREYRLENIESIKAYAKRYYQENKTLFQKHRIKNRRKKYRITDADFDRMAREQDYLCAICKAPPVNHRFKTLCVDHDHATGKVRGLLCHNCNAAIGMLKDSVTIIRSAANYMEFHSGYSAQSA